MSHYSWIILWGKRSVGALFIGSLVLVFLLCWSSYIIEKEARPYLYSSLSHLPVMKTAVVLGTSRYTSEGNRNVHYYERLKAAEALYNKGKVKFIIVSGDNSTRYYNEPARMKADLVSLGIPANVIYRDYAGFRTLDSVVRAARVFDQKAFIIVSQRYQNARAIYIAHQYGINAVAYNANGGFSFFDVKNHLRVWFARLLAVIQVNILHTQPHFLGPLIIPGITPPT